MKNLIKAFFIVILIIGIPQYVNSVGGELEYRIRVLPEKVLPTKDFDISNSLKYQHLQKKALSCEVSATADILSYFLDKEIDENILLEELGKSKYQEFPEYKDGKMYWGDLQKGFVGYIDKIPSGETARQRLSTGYGVLEQPINKIFKNWGFETTVITKENYPRNFTPKDHLDLILEELTEGNMVQLWGDICTNPVFASGKEHPCFYNGKPSWNQDRTTEWYYTDKNGKEQKYTGLIGEHAFYLLGFKGDIKNPTHIIVRDTFTGKHEYFTSEWMRKWELMEYRSIVVYAK